MDVEGRDNEDKAKCVTVRRGDATGGSKKQNRIDEAIDCVNIFNKHMVDYVDVVPATTKTYWEGVYEHILSGLTQYTTMAK